MDETVPGDGPVQAFIALKVDTKRADTVAESLTELDEMDDVYLVTGDPDLLISGSFDNAEALDRFLSEKVLGLRGVRDATKLIVTRTVKRTR